MLLSQKNIRFSDFVQILKAFGFSHQRTNGSHQIYFNIIINKDINIQNFKGEAKSYQVRDFLKLIQRYELSFKD